MAQPLTQALLRAAARSAREATPRFEAQWQARLSGVPPAHQLEFTVFVGERLDRTQPLSQLDALPIDDMVLVFACLRGDAQALSAFDARFLALLPSQLTRAGFSSEVAEEARLRVAEKLLVPSPGEAPRLGTFSGKSPLASWLRVVALREAMRVQRQATPGVDVDDLALELEAAGEDPELSLFKKKFRSEFAEAFRAAIEEMEAQQRLILRQYFIDDLSIDQLAAIHHVHRATSARWVAHSRAELVRLVKRRLQSTLRIEASEVSQLVRAVRSGFDLSLRRFLG